WGAHGCVVKQQVAQIDTPRRFQGQYHDPEPGLHCNRHRYYNPTTGRFLTPDPIGLAGGLNNYQYVPNPTGWVDPLGLVSQPTNCPESNGTWTGDDIVETIGARVEGPDTPKSESVVSDETLLLTHSSKTRFFKGDEAVQHFSKHSSELMQAFGRSSYNLKNYLGDANHIINNGIFVPEMNGYVRLIGGKGSAKYGFVGLDRATGKITTFHVKSVSELARKAPSLGFSK